MNSLHFYRPPRTLTTARLDNLVLVPASLLSNMATFQAAANRLPQGQVLIVLPSSEGAAQRALKSTAAHMRSRGHPVTTLAADRLE